jgi:hypothetical protein
MRHHHSFHPWNDLQNSLTVGWMVSCIVGSTPTEIVGSTPTEIGGSMLTQIVGSIQIHFRLYWMAS